MSGTIKITELDKALSSLGGDGAMIAARRSNHQGFGLTDNEYLVSLETTDLALPPYDLLRNRPAIFNSVCRHVGQVAVISRQSDVLYSGKSGTEMFSGGNLFSAENNTVWASDENLVRESMGEPMNNPFHYMHHRWSEERPNGLFVPLLAIYDRTLLDEAGGNLQDHTHWKPKDEGVSVNLAMKLAYYIDPGSFTFDKSLADPIGSIDR